ncbi:VOC family protein [Psychrobacillus sp. NPDC096623]|uniref:VOC family protein n=1 Tax=Psychrobacillus sp. NPDC096623 TaxID=3364492 RepID=UPI00381613A6
MINKRITFIGIALVLVLTSLFFVFKSKESAYGIYDINSPSRLQEVHLNVSNLEKLSTFYQEVIGFDILKEEKNRITLTADGSTPLLVLEETPDSVERPIKTTGLYHFAILLPDHASLGTMLVHLSQTEYPMDGAANHQYSDAIYFTDPDGNGIEIYVDLPPEKWERSKEGGYVGGSYPIDFDMLIEEATPSWAGLPVDTRIGHMHLQAAELEITEQFYVEGLGFSVTTKGNGALFLSKDNYHHHVALNTWAGTGLPAPPSNSRGLKQFTIIFTKEEIEQAKSELKRLDFPFETAEDSIVVEDPSGNTLHIVSK